MSVMSAEFRRGLEAAADHLERTAADYLQMAGRITIPDPSVTLPMRRGHLIQQKQEFISKAELLRGQANHIRGLK